MSYLEYSFTPSEYILLNGDKFAPELTGENSLPLLCSDGCVDGAFLASLMCAAAILANEEEGTIKPLELNTTKKLFGLRELTQLIIRPSGIPANWNGFTLESGIVFFSSQAYAVPGDYSVQKTIYNIMVKDRKQPWMKIIEMVEWGLAASNWLLPVKGEAAAAFSTPFICPANVRELVLSQDSTPFVKLLTSTKKERPEIWKQLTSEINQAFEDRKIG
jgi:hypothetical protein